MTYATHLHDNFTKLNVVRTGSGGPHVILLHSLGLDAESWQPTADLLSSRFVVHAIDVPGHGRTPRSRVQLTIEDYADLVERLIVESSAARSGGSRVLG